MNKSLCFVVAFLFLAATEAVLPNGDCYVNDLTCEIDDNFIGIVDNIMSAEECKQECKNNSGGGMPGVLVLRASWSPLQRHMPPI